MPEIIDLRVMRQETVDATILKWLVSKGETGATYREMAEHFGFNYHTARNHIMRLMREKKVEISPTVTRAAHYRAIHYGGMPMVNENTSLWKFIARYADAETPLASTERTRHVLFSLAELFSFAERYANGGSINRKQVQETRERLISSKTTLKNLLELIDTVLNTRDLWHSNESLKKALLEDPNHPVTTDQVSQAFSNHVTRYESSKGNI